MLNTDFVPFFLKESLSQLTLYLSHLRMDGGWMGGWMDGWMDGWKDEWIDG